MDAPGPRPATRRPVGVALLSAAAFAVGPIAAKLAFDGGGNTPAVVAARGVIGAALMAVLVAASGRGFRVRGRALAHCFYAGLAGTAMSYTGPQKS